MKAKPCVICFNSPLTGYLYTPIECESISKALELARLREKPYRLYDKNGNLIRKGWMVK